MPLNERAIPRIAALRALRGKSGRATARSFGVGDACDNCPADFNSAQADAHGDLVGDVCDLSDGVIFLSTHDDTIFEWQSESGYGTWNWYRGDMAVPRSTGLYTQEPGTNSLAARKCGLTSPTVNDSTLPVR